MYKTNENSRPLTMALYNNNKSISARAKVVYSTHAK